MKALLDGVATGGQTERAAAISQVIKALPPGIRRILPLEEIGPELRPMIAAFDGNAGDRPA